MKPKIASKCLGSLFTMVLTIAMAAPAHAQCSLAHAAGKWALTDQGTVLGIGPRTAVGVFGLDGVGNVQNGVATSSLNGAIASETFSGTYTVNPDCTGTINVNIYDSGTETLIVTLNTAFDEDMKHMRAIFTSVATPGGTQLSTVVNFDARKQ
jgi:hypothetical protein